MRTITQHIVNGGILIVLCSFVAVSSNAETRRSSVQSQNTGLRISKGNAGQLASVLGKIAGLATDQEQREIRATVRDLTNQTSTVNLGISEVQKIRTWLHEHRAQDAGLTEKVDYLLVALGDTNTLSRVLTRLRSGHPADRLDVPMRLSQSEHPIVITALSQDLFLEEPVHPVEDGMPEFRTDPPSVTATYIINAILAASLSFQDETRSWAKGLLQIKLEKRRDLLRRWWKKNEQHFADGKFALVVPLSESESSITADDYLPQRRPIRKIE